MRTPQFIIYGLEDPRTGEVRYVGKSSSGLRRARSHSGPKRSASEHTHKARWVRSLLARGEKPRVVVLEVCAADDLADVECYWIAQGRGLGWRLTNATKGGDGLGGFKHSAATKKKIGAANASALRGRRATAEARANQSAALRGVPRGPRSAAQKANAASAVRALWADPVYRAMQVAKRVAKWEDPEYRKTQTAAIRRGKGL